jgi:glyoxylase-like metal-dependent hydrolase (beta-lactamase superfamily II)
MIEITKEIFLVGGQGLTWPHDAAIYLMHFGGEAALVDAGCGYQQDKLLQQIAACNVPTEDIKYLLLTHCHYDHTGGARQLKTKLGVKVIAHELDAGYLESGDNAVTAADWYGAQMDPIDIDRKLKDPQEKIELGGREITAIHAPGHSPGSVVYLTVSDGLKVVFAQDVHGPLDRRLMSNRKDYKASLRLLADLEADILCEGHYGIYRGQKDIRQFIGMYLS